MDRFESLESSALMHHSSPQCPQPSPSELEDGAAADESRSLPLSEMRKFIRAVRVSDDHRLPGVFRLHPHDAAIEQVAIGLPIAL